MQAGVRGSIGVRGLGRRALIMAGLVYPLLVLGSVDFPVPYIDAGVARLHPSLYEPRNLRIEATVKNSKGEYVDAYVAEYDSRGRLILAVRGNEERYRYETDEAPLQWTERITRWSDDHKEKHTRVIDELGYPATTTLNLPTDGKERRYSWRRDSIQEVRIGGDRLKIKQDKSGRPVAAEVWKDGSRAVNLRFEYRGDRLSRRIAESSAVPDFAIVHELGYTANGRLQSVIQRVELTKKGKANKATLPSPNAAAIALAWEGSKLVRKYIDADYRGNRIDPDHDTVYSYDEKDRLIREVKSGYVDRQVFWSVGTDPVYGTYELARELEKVSGVSKETRFFRTTADNRGRGRDDFMMSYLDYVGQAMAVGLGGAVPRVARNCFIPIQIVSDFEPETFYSQDAYATSTHFSECEISDISAMQAIHIEEREEDSAPQLFTFSDEDKARFREQYSWSVPIGAYRACIVDAPGTIGQFISRTAATADAGQRQLREKRIPDLLREWAVSCGGGYDWDVYKPICDEQQGKPLTENFFCGSIVTEQDGFIYRNNDTGFALSASDIRRIIFYQQGRGDPATPHLGGVLKVSDSFEVGASVPAGAMLMPRQADFQTATRFGDALAVLQIVNNTIIVTVTADTTQLGNKYQRSSLEFRAPGKRETESTPSWLPGLGFKQHDLVAQRDVEQGLWVGNEMAYYQLPYINLTNPPPPGSEVFIHVTVGNSDDRFSKSILVPIDSAAFWAYLLGNQAFGEYGRNVLANASAAERPSMYEAIAKAQSQGGFSFDGSCGAEPRGGFSAIRPDVSSVEYERAARRVQEASYWINCRQSALAYGEGFVADYLAANRAVGPTDAAFWRGLLLQVQRDKARSAVEERRVRLAQARDSVEAARRDIERWAATERRKERREEERLRAERNQAAYLLWERKQGPEGYYDCLETAYTAAAQGQCSQDYLKRMQDASAFAGRVAASQRAKSTENRLARNSSSRNSNRGGSSGGPEAVLCVTTNDPDTDTCMSSEARKLAYLHREREQNREELRQWFMDRKRECLAQNVHGQSCGHSGVEATDAAHVPAMLPDQLRFSAMNTGKLSGFSGLDTSGLPGDCPASEDNGTTVTTWRQTGIVKSEPYCITHHAGDQAAISCKAMATWDCEAEVRRKTGNGER